MFEGLKERFGFTEDTDASQIDIEQRHESQVGAYKFIIASLIVVIGMLGLGYMGEDKARYATVEIPSTIYAETPLKVGNGWTNDMYMKVWGDWMLNKTANFSPTNVKENFNEALRFFSQDKAYSYVGSMGALSNLVIRNQLKQSFTIKHFDPVYYSDTEFMEVASGEDKIRSAVLTYKGIATQSLGNNALPDKECQYTIGIKFEGGHLYGFSYNTDCFK